MVNPDFAKIAEAMGFKGVTVHEPADVHQAVLDGLTHDGPVLLNILTNPNSLAMPPKIEWEQVKGYAQTMTKMMLGGRMDDILEMVRSNYKHLSEVI
jgi:pyruvate dehydrogenase (quinone)